jgi:cytoplasmic iron level regulating protein YaaA (DUF328/UPF0246 family)
VLILLPPSESKTARPRGTPMDLARLSSPELTEARGLVVDSLGRVCAAPDAASALGVSPNLREEIVGNTRLATTPAVRVGDLYTGVLYDALDLPSLDAASRRRAVRRLLVVSALYGALRITDRVAPYRLSMAVNLPGVGPLARHWRGPLASVVPGLVGRGLVVDCRSSTYAAAWVPQPDLADRWVQVRVPGATHMAKHTRGLVARELCTSGADPRTPQRLAETLRPTFHVELQAPGPRRAGWVLDVTARCR